MPARCSACPANMRADHALRLEREIAMETILLAEGRNPRNPQIFTIVHIAAERIYRLIKSFGIVKIGQLALLYIERISRLERDILLEVPVFDRRSNAWLSERIFPSDANSFQLIR